MLARIVLFISRSNPSLKIFSKAIVDLVALTRRRVESNNFQNEKGDEQ